jgi:ComF family protein
MNLNGILWLSHLFFPRECVHCRVLLDYRNRDYLCDGCRDLLEAVAEPLCERCGEPLEITEPGPVNCPACLKHPPAFRRARSALYFSGPGESLVRTYKYSAHPYLSGPCLRLLLAGGESWYGWKGYDRVVPVPLHPRKARERGFDQSAILAAGLSRKTGVPLEKRALFRVRYTSTQTRLKRTERRENIRGAFSVPAPDRVRGASLLLVDDVYTTGATVNECAATLMEAGAKNVDVLTLARAVHR